MGADYLKIVYVSKGLISCTSGQWAEHWEVDLLHHKISKNSIRFQNEWKINQFINKFHNFDSKSWIWYMDYGTQSPNSYNPFYFIFRVFKNPNEY